MFTVDLHAFLSFPFICWFGSFHVIFYIFTHFFISVIVSVSPVCLLPSGRFRQLEVLHQVTTAFNSLVGGGGAGGALKSSDSQGALAIVSPETREKRKRMGLLLRRASKKTLSQARASQDQAPPPSPLAASPAAANPEPLGPPMPTPAPVPVFPSDKRGLLKRSRSSLVENGSLTTLVEEQGTLGEAPEVQAQAEVLSAGHQESPVRLRGPRELRGLVPTPLVRKRSPGEPMESFELEEVKQLPPFSPA